MKIGKIACKKTPNPFGDYYSKSTLDVWFHEFWDPLPEATITKGNPPRVQMCIRDRLYSIWIHLNNADSI